MTSDKMSAAENEQKWHLLDFLLDLIGFGTSWSYSAGSSKAMTGLMRCSGPLLTPPQPAVVWYKL